MKGMILALDQGTSSSRSLLIRRSQGILSSAVQPLTCTYPHPGWVEQDPEEIWQSQKTSMEQALAQGKTKLSEVAAIGITNQRETTLAWNKETGEPLGPAIVWQCRRTAEFCEEAKAQGWGEKVKEKTGLVLDPYFSGTKMAWILQHNRAAKKLADCGKLALGTVDSWLIYRLSGNRAHRTDASNASRTLLYNLQTGTWDEELANWLGIPLEALPSIQDSSGEFARLDRGLWGADTPITGVAGDQQASLFGQACFAPGDAKSTYGTGCFLLVNTGNSLAPAKNGLINTVAWQLQGKRTYALEGSIFMAGALIQWLRDQLGLFSDATQTAAMAASLKDNGGVYLVPAFVGLGAPHWDPYARGTICGLTRDSNKNHLARAGLEAIAFQAADLLEAMRQETGFAIQTLKIDGGASANPFLCQFQADIAQVQIDRSKNSEATAMGAAFLAGLAVGLWKNQAEIQATWQRDCRFEPEISATQALRQRQGWLKALERSKGWAKP